MAPQRNTPSPCRSPAPLLSTVTWHLPPGWVRSNDDTTGTTVRVVPPAVVGSHTFCATVDDGSCPSTLHCLDIGLGGTVGVEEEGRNTLRVYPVPSTGMVQVECVATGNTNAQLVDIHGRLVLTTTLGIGLTTLDLRTLRDGVYGLLMHEGGTRVVRTVVVQR